MKLCDQGEKVQSFQFVPLMMRACAHTAHTHNQHHKYCVRLKLRTPTNFTFTNSTCPHVHVISNLIAKLKAFCCFPLATQFHFAHQPLMLIKLGSPRCDQVCYTTKHCIYQNALCVCEELFPRTPCWKGMKTLYIITCATFQMFPKVGQCS